MRHQTSAIAISARLQHYGIDDGEDCGVGADTKRERQNRSHGESWALAQRTQSVTQVLNPDVPKRLAPHVAYLLFHRSHVAEGAAGGVLGVFRSQAGILLFFPFKFQVGA